ncbi:MAG: 3-phosphoserine/phosphohydroxythreonine transaminase [Treponemataceae bacterium]
MSRVYNFSAGPSALPEEVLKQAASEMLDYNGSGQSVMEMSHRSSVFDQIMVQTKSLLRELLDIPSGYKVLFIQGGATLQFSMVPLNLVRKGRAAYVETGIWAEKAIVEAQKVLDVDVVASSKKDNYTYIPSVPIISDDYEYLHITYNNTIVGTRFKEIPSVNVPLVADISSCILSEPLDISQFGLLYAGAQKNLAPSGVTLVIIREDLIGRANPKIPVYLDYKTHAQNHSVYNTPPCYTIYMMKLVLEWVKRNRGAKGMKKLNEEKASLLYNYLDQSDFYYSPIQKDSRSLMNIPFITYQKDAKKAEQLNKQFVLGASKAGLVNLAGHKLVGGMRASLYNAMPIDGVQALIAFMDEFAKQHTS